MFFIHFSFFIYFQIGVDGSVYIGSSYGDYIFRLGPDRKNLAALYVLVVYLHNSIYSKKKSIYLFIYFILSCILIF